jgi:prepilin peptidase CpaA
MVPGLADLLVVTTVGVSAVTDLRTGKILNAVTYPAMVLGFTGALTGTGPSVASSALGFVVGGGFLYVMFACGWMGGGDVKLMAAIGAIKGFPFILNAMFYSVFLGGVAAAVMLIWRGHGRAVLSDVAVVARRVMAPGLPSDPIVPRGGTFPFGVAICLGTLTALALEWQR